MKKQTLITKGYFGGNGGQNPLQEPNGKESTRTIESECHGLLSDMSRAWPLMPAREEAIHSSVQRTILMNVAVLDEASSLIAEWMSKQVRVRIIGAGRALLAGLLPANRMVHGGAIVSSISDPLPVAAKNLGGGMISVSGSGKTKEVLKAMKSAKNDSEITIVGIAQYSALGFARLCDVFIGIYKSQAVNPLSVFADVEEMVITHVLDALIAMAGKKLGYTELDWNHEDLGSSGPYRRQDILQKLNRKGHKSR